MSFAAFGLLWLLVFTIPWENAVALPGIGTLNRLIGAAALGGGLVWILVRGRIRTPRLFLLAVSLFVAWSGLTLFWTVDTFESQRRVQTYLQLALMSWLIWELADTEDRQTKLLEAFILGCWCLAGATIWSYLTGSQTIDRRYTAEGSNANDVALTLVLGIPMAWYLAVTKAGWIWRWSNRAYVVVALMALLLTASRGAFIAALAALALIPWSFGRLDWKSKFVLSVIVVASAWAFAMIIPPESWTRLATTHSELSEGTIGFRKTIWMAGLNVALAHPMLGVGAGTFAMSVAPDLARPFAAHNAFLAVLVEQGAIGLVLFAGVFVTAFVSSWSPPPMTTRFRVVLLATLVIGVMPLNWDYVKTTWFILALLASQGTLIERPRRYSVANPHSPLPYTSDLSDVPEVVTALHTSGERSG